MKRIFTQIQINKIRVRMILMANEILQELLKIKKIIVMVTFLSMNGVNIYAFQTWNCTCAAQETTISNI